MLAFLSVLHCVGLEGRKCHVLNTQDRPSLDSAHYSFSRSQTPWRSERSHFCD